MKVSRRSVSNVMARGALPTMLIIWTLVFTAPVHAGEDPSAASDGPVLWTPVEFGYDGSGHFTENLGQWDSPVGFAASTTFGHSLFTEDGVIYDVDMDEGGHRIKLSFDGKSSVDPEGLGDLGYPTNYLIGNDRDEWVTGARSFEQLVYRDVWPGIDVRYRFSGSALKYDLLLDGDADPSLIKFKVEGSQGLDVSRDGLDIRLSRASSIRDTDLVAWYADGEPVEVWFTLDGDSYGFQVDGPMGRPMVIDPMVMHSGTYLGGTYGERANDVIVDRDDNIVLVGDTSSSDYPTTLGAYQQKMENDFDVVVTKMNHNASRIIWSTFIGGSRTDWVNALAVDEANNLYLAGNTWSGDWPITKGSYCEDMNLGLGQYNIDIYVTRLNPQGDTVEASTFIGGTAAEMPYDVDVRDGTVAIGAYTISPDFPTTRGSHAANMGAAAVITMDRNLSMMEGCYIWDGVASENVKAVAIDKNGDVALAGWTGSPGFPTSPGAYKAVEGWPRCSFVARYSPSSDNLLFCTLLGDGYGDYVETLVVDDDLNIYLAGVTQQYLEISHPVTEGAYDQVHNGSFECWVTKMDPDGTKLIHSTLLGGEGREYIYDIALDGDGNLVVVGTMDIDTNFDLTPDCHDDTHAGDSEGFIVVLNEDFSEAVYSSLHGGNHEDELFAVFIDAVDNYVVVGRTSSSDLPVTEDGFQTRYAGVEDIVVAVIGELTPTSAPLSLKASGEEGHIYLTWLPPVDDGGYPLREYHIYRGLTEDDLRPYKVMDDTISYADEDVEWGVTYHYAVYASNWKGMSPRSNIDSAVSVIAPDAPFNLTAVVDVGTVSLEWQAPNFTGGLPLIEFRVYRTAKGSQMEMVASLGPGETTFQDLDAEDGTEYAYFITALNEYDESKRDAKVTVLTMAVPTPPQDLTHEYGELFITLTWMPPREDFGLPVREYRIYRQTEEGPKELIGVLENLERSFTDTHVMMGQSYRYQVTAINARGESQPSMAMNATVRLPPGRPTDVKAVAHTGFVKIIWAPPTFDGASPILGYQVYLVGEEGRIISIGGKNIEGIENVQLAFLHDVPYDSTVRGYVVTAFNAEGEGDPSPTAFTSVYLAPSAPMGPVVEWGDGTLSLEWLAPESNGGTAITSFTVYRLKAGQSAPVSIVMVPLDIIAFTDDTVENGIEYTYTVTATNMVGEGPQSTSVSGIPAGLPTEPMGVGAEGLDGSVKVTWLTPISNGGRSIAGYRVFTVVDGTNVKQIAQLGPEETEFVHDGLVNGEVYVYTMKALTSVGTSGISDMVEARPVGPPSGPVDIEAFWMGDHVLVTWDVPPSDGGSPILGYKLLRGDWDEANWTGIMDPTYADADVEPGATYNYTVYAYTEVGPGPVAHVTFTVPMEQEPPLEPEVFEWTYLVMLVIVVTLAISVLYMTFRRKDDEDDRRV